MYENLSRRSLGAALALGAAVGAARAATDDENANVALVGKFCSDWSTKDVEKLIPYLSPDIEYHVFEGGPIIKGVEQFRAQMGGFMAGLKEIAWETKRSAAIGDLVINERIDHFIQAEGSKRPDNHFHIAGVFIVRDGKIVYWKDWRMPGAA
jgi:limonene-1,2-epoxide hydrolase